MKIPPINALQETGRAVVLGGAAMLFLAVGMIATESALPGLQSANSSASISGQVERIGEPISSVSREKGLQTVRGRLFVDVTPGGDLLAATLIETGSGRQLDLQTYNENQLDELLSRLDLSGQVTVSGWISGLLGEEQLWVSLE